MSKDWVKDIHEMHLKFGADLWVKDKLLKSDKEILKKLLEFRLNFLGEELLETRKALASEDAEEIVDGLIDLCVVAIGTLDLMKVDAHKAWDEILRANMDKKAGIKPGRPNPLGLPDLMKPDGWIAPSHVNNHGDLDYVLNK